MCDGWNVSLSEAVPLCTNSRVFQKYPLPSDDKSSPSIKRSLRGTKMGQDFQKKGLKGPKL